MKINFLITSQCSHLGDKAHDTEAEMKSVVEVLCEVHALISSTTSSAAVDNAACSVAMQLLRACSEKVPSDSKPRVTCKASHCLDLDAKISIA